MPVYNVTYDLIAPGKDYDGLIETLKAMPDWWHGLQSTWLVTTPLKANELRDKLRPFLDVNDKIFVSRLDTTAVASWSPNLNPVLADYLKRNGFTLT